MLDSSQDWQFFIHYIVWHLIACDRRTLLGRDILFQSRVLYWSTTKLLIKFRYWSSCKAAMKNSCALAADKKPHLRDILKAPEGRGLLHALTARNIFKLIWVPSHRCLFSWRIIFSGKNKLLIFSCAIVLKETLRSYFALQLFSVGIIIKKKIGHRISQLYISRRSGYRMFGL